MTKPTMTLRKALAEVRKYPHGSYLHDVAFDQLHKHWWANHKTARTGPNHAELWHWIDIQESEALHFAVGTHVRVKDPIKSLGIMLQGYRNQIGAVESGQHKPDADDVAVRFPDGRVLFFLSTELEEA